MEIGLRPPIKPPIKPPKPPKPRSAVGRDTDQVPVVLDSALGQGGLPPTSDVPISVSSINNNNNNNCKTASKIFLLFTNLIFTVGLNINNSQGQYNS